MTDFTLEKYRALLKAVSDYRPLTFSQYFSKKKTSKPILLLRHDVDRLPQNALVMAKLEEKEGFKATYFFRIGNFRPDLVKEIARLGHEIGYHYESLDQAKGNLKKALELFTRDLKSMRRVYPIKTICMHGNPLTPFDNRDLFKTKSYRRFGILGEAYLDLDKDFVYFSDAGRTWSNKFKLKDRLVQSKPNRLSIKNTDELILNLKRKKYFKLCLNTHPERWNANWQKWLGYWFFDKAAQIYKALK